MASQFHETKDRIVFIQVEPDADEAKVQALLTAGAKAAFPTVEVLNQGELKEQQEEQIQGVVMFFYVLLALAIVISVFGIANTLSLSIHERRRELGMLRAIGMSRRAGAADDPLRGGDHGADRRHPRDRPRRHFRLPDRPAAEVEGFRLSFPVGQLVIVFLVAGLIGVLAAIVPARRASRLDVLESLQYE